ncbi:hypothetical protein ON010_g14508 [Phytophthora cinnamomi]|nr:hypothetical protein ON010_g14508 [Phytophthora cinnamomi]
MYTPVKGNPLGGGAGFAMTQVKIKPRKITLSINAMIKASAARRIQLDKHHGTKGTEHERVEVVVKRLMAVANHCPALIHGPRKQRDRRHPPEAPHFEYSQHEHRNDEIVRNLQGQRPEHMIALRKLEREHFEQANLARVCDYKVALLVFRRQPRQHERRDGEQRVHAEEPFLEVVGQREHPRTSTGTLGQQLHALLHEQPRQQEC